MYPTKQDTDFYEMVKSLRFSVNQYAKSKVRFNATYMIETVNSLLRTLARLIDEAKLLNSAYNHSLIIFGALDLVSDLLKSAKDKLNHDEDVREDFKNCLTHLDTILDDPPTIERLVLSELAYIRQIIDKNQPRRIPGSMISSSGLGASDTINLEKALTNIEKLVSLTESE